MNFVDPIARRLGQGDAVTLARAPEGYDAFVIADLTRALAAAGETRAVTLVVVARDGMQGAEHHRRARLRRPRDRGPASPFVGLPAL